MTEANPRYDDEIDLIDLFLTMWIGKWVIIGCMAIPLLAAALYLALVETKYESRILIKQNIVPPFLEITNFSPALALEEFMEKFHSQDVLNAWAEENNEKLFTPNHGLSKFYDIENRQTELILNTDNMQIINAHYRYVNYVNQHLTQDYQTSSKEELIFLKEQAQEIGSYSELVVNLILNTNRFLRDAARGELVFDTMPPTQPVKISPKTELVLALSVILGGFVGCAYVLLLSVLRKRKHAEA